MLGENREHDIASLAAQLGRITELVGTAADNFRDDLGSICYSQELLQAAVTVSIEWLQTTAYFVGITYRDECEDTIRDVIAKLKTEREDE